MHNFLNFRVDGEMLKRQFSTLATESGLFSTILVAMLGLQVGLVAFFCYYITIGRVDGEHTTTQNCMVGIIRTGPHSSRSGPGRPGGSHYHPDSAGARAGDLDVAMMLKP